MFNYNQHEGILHYILEDNICKKSSYKASKATKNCPCLKWLISSKIKIKLYFPFLATKCIKLGFKKGIKNAENCRFEMGIAGHISIHTLNAGSSTTYVWLKVGFASLPGIDFHRAFGSNKAFWALLQFQANLAATDCSGSIK